MKMNWEQGEPNRFNVNSEKSELRMVSREKKLIKLNTHKENVQIFR